MYQRANIKPILILFYFKVNNPRLLKLSSKDNFFSHPFPHLYFFFFFFNFLEVSSSVPLKRSPNISIKAYLFWSELQDYLILLISHWSVTCNLQCLLKLTVLHWTEPDKGQTLRGFHDKHFWFDHKPLHLESKIFSIFSIISYECIR